MTTSMREALEPINMQDVRLVCGEGKLEAKHVLEAVNIILKQRTERAALSSQATDRLSEEERKQIERLKGTDYEGGRLTVCALVAIIDRLSRQPSRTEELTANISEQAQRVGATFVPSAEKIETYEAARAARQPEAEPVAWRKMKDAPRDGSPVVLRWADNGSGLQGCAILEYDQNNPKGNPWRMPMCHAWFGEVLFDAWMPAPPVYTSPRRDRERVERIASDIVEKLNCDWGFNKNPTRDEAAATVADAIMRETR